MKKLFLVNLFVLTIVLSNSSFSQTSDLAYKIESKKIVLRNKQAQIKVELTNISNTRYILYGYRWLTNSCAGMQYYTTDEISVVSEIIIEKEGKQIFAIPTPITERVTWNDVEREIEECGLTDQNSKVILEPKLRRQYILSFDLAEFRLKPGEYSLFLAYSCGKYSVNFISEEIQKADEQKYDAKVFYGWFFSNKVKLIVK